jgi:hypothetical protein
MDNRTPPGRHDLPHLVLCHNRAMKPATRTKMRVAAILAGAVAFITFRALSASPAVVEAWYASSVGPFLASFLSRATGWIPISLLEIILALFVFRQLHGIAWGLSMMRLGEWKPAAALGRGLFRLASDLGLVVAIFYVVWGFNYARSPLEVRQGWDGKQAGAEELTVLALDMVDAANEEYLAIHESEDAGAATDEVLDRRDLTASIEKGWRQAARLLNEPWLERSFGRPKPLLASRALDYLGIAGIYFPFTGEANFNGGAPPESLPRVLGHEMAHQRGYAREDEANFMGFLSAALSPDPWPRYSAAVFAQRQLVNALAQASPDRARAMVQRRLPGVHRDITESDAYWARFAGPMNDAAQSVNNAYLKSQKVPGGVLSYARSVELMVSWSRSHEGALPRSGVVPR